MIRLTKKTIIITLLLATLVCAKDGLDMTAIVVGADAVGRGNAYVGNIDANYLLYQNFSGLTDLTGKVLSATSVRLLGEFNYLALAYDWQNWGIGYHGVQASGGYIRDNFNNLTGDEITYGDHNFYLAYAKKIKSFRTALRFRYMKRSLAAVKESASGYTFDFAGHYDVNNLLQLGLRVDNLLLGQMNWSTGENEDLPKEIIFGSKFKLFGEGSYRPNYRLETNLLADIVIEKRGTLLRIGMEAFPISNIALRGGLEQKFKSINNNSFQKTLLLTLGLGFNYANFYFDYAYHPQDVIDDTITHYFSVAYRFGDKFGDKDKKRKPVATTTTYGDTVFDNDQVQIIPLHDYTTYEDSVLVQAKVIGKNVAKVKLADDEIAVNGNSKLISSQVPLQVGINKLPVKAYDSQGKLLYSGNFYVERKATFLDIQDLADKDIIEDLATLGLLKTLVGSEEKFLEPFDYVNRRGLFVILGNLLQEQGVAIEEDKDFRSFGDYEYDDSDYEIIAYAAASGLLIGDNEGNARLDDVARRDEAASIFVRYENVSPRKCVNDNFYTDVNKDHWAFSDINRSREIGLTQGIGKGLYLPKDDLNRLDTIRMLSRTSQVTAKRQEYLEQLNRLVKSQPKSK